MDSNILMYLMIHDRLFSFFKMFNSQEPYHVLRVMTLVSFAVLVARLAYIFRPLKAEATYIDDDATTV